MTEYVNNTISLLPNGSLFLLEQGYACYWYLKEFDSIFNLSIELNGIDRSQDLTEYSCQQFVAFNLDPYTIYTMEDNIKTEFLCICSLPDIMARGCVCGGK